MGNGLGHEMTREDREAIELLRSTAERHRRRALLLSALGESEQAEACRVIAKIQEERASRLERRAT